MSCSSSQQLGISSGSNNEQCLLLSLRGTLKRLQIDLDGQGVTCRRASNDQKQALLNFNETIYDYYYSLVTQEIFETVSQSESLDIEWLNNMQPLIYPPSVYFQPFPRESRSTCRYTGLNMTDHVKSLYTLVPPLSNLTSSEAQLISGNLTEVILPIVKPLVVSTGLYLIDTYLSFVNYWSYAIITIYYRMCHLGKGFLNVLSTVQHRWLQFPHSVKTKRLPVSWTDWDVPTSISWESLKSGTLSHRMTLASNTPADHRWITIGRMLK